MNDYHRHAEQLCAALKLSLPPVAVSFSDAAPTEIPHYLGVVPAGCKFWQEAAKQTFITSVVDHELCSIGVHTHSLFGAPASQSEELKSTLEAMTGLDYVRQEEVASIPVMQRQYKHVIYGPLADFSLTPEVILLFAHAHQGLILSEATERVDGAVPLAMGRPACAVIPQVLNQGRAAMSLGCCGARAYLDELSDSVTVWALPGGKLSDYCGQIDVLSHANSVLSTFHERRRRDVESGKRPSIRSSLQRLEQ